MVRVVIIILLMASCSYAQFYKSEDGLGYYQYKDKIITDNNTLKRPRVPLPEELSKMPTAEFRQLYSEVFDYALTVRNIDTYSDYAKMQIEGIKRANEFASLQLVYAQNNPRDNSINAPELHQIELNKNISETLIKNKSEFGLIYFYSETCSYCTKQSPLLELFKTQYGWEIEAINIDQKPGFVSKFNITSTPAIFMLDRKKNLYPLVKAS